MDPDCEPLQDYLHPAAKILDPFGLENMRCKWRRWLHFDCNWKVALEAFNETYHVFTTHPEFNRFGEFKGWARAQASTATSATTPRRPRRDAVQDPPRHRRPADLDRGDAGVHDGGDQRDHHPDAGERRAATGRRTARGHPGRQGPRALAGLGPPRRRGARGDLAGDPAGCAGAERHRLADLPELPDRTGTHQRPVLQARPDPGYDPDKCIFEAAVYELYPEGEEPQTEWEYTRWAIRAGAACCRRTSRTWPRCSRDEVAGLPRHAAKPVPRAQHRQPAPPTVEVHGHRRTAGAHQERDR